MTQAQYQPDFILTIGDTDVTKYLEHWEFEDLEDNLSSLKATIINKDGMFSGKFKHFDKMVLRFGYQGSLGPKVTMEVTEKGENYTTRGLRVFVTGMDPAHRLVGTTAAGSFLNPSMLGVMKEIAEMHNLKLELKQKNLKDPKLETDDHIKACNERLIALQRRLARELFKDKKTGTTKGVSASRNPKKPIKNTKQPTKTGSFYGRLSNGNKIGRTGGVAYKAQEEGLNNTQRNFLLDLDDGASSASIQGHIELIGVPILRAMQCITVLNVGPEASGKWYVRGVRHEWDVRHGYHTLADLLRGALGKEDDSEEASGPIVMRGDPYKEETFVVGERDMNAKSQATFTFGHGDKRIVSFKWSAKVEESKEAGEGGSTERTFLDAPKQVGTSQIIPGESPVTQPIAPQEHNPEEPPF